MTYVSLAPAEQFTCCSKKVLRYCFFLNKLIYVLSVLVERLCGCTYIDLKPSFMLSVFRCWKSSHWQILLFLLVHTSIVLKGKATTSKSRCTFGSVELIIHIYNPLTIFAPISLRFPFPISNAALPVKFTEVATYLLKHSHIAPVVSHHSRLSTYILCIRKYVYYDFVCLFFYYSDCIIFVPSIVTIPVSCKLLVLNKCLLYKWKWEKMPCF